MKGMHMCLDNITKNINIDRILVDGNYFKIYSNNDFEFIPHVCIPGGDNLYYNIAAASILAKEYRDEYIINLYNDNNTLLNKYDIFNNKGYGTKNHLTAIKNMVKLNGIENHLILNNLLFSLSLRSFFRFFSRTRF
jgi:ribonuclease HII